MKSRQQWSARWRPFRELWRRYRGRFTGVAVGAVVASVLYWLFKELVLDLVGGWLLDGFWAVPLWILAIVGMLVAARSWWLGRATRAGETTLPALSTLDLIGRDITVRRVLSSLARHSVIAVVGRRGIGTSACMLSVAQSISPQCPDGQLHLDLRNAGASAPLSGPQALRRILELAGLAPPRSDQPRHLEVAAHSLRAWLAGRRVMIILDNVDDPEQVAYLLHEVPGCPVLLAGCVELATLPGVLAHDLPVLSEKDAVALLSRGLGGTPDDADGRARVELVNLCGRQPGAILLLGEIIRRSGWPPERANEVMRASLDVAAYDSSAQAALAPVWDACSSTFDDLWLDHHAILRVFALVPKAHIGLHAIAAAARIPTDRANRLLTGLIRRGLLRSVSLGHYQLDELVAPSARYWLGSQQSPIRVRRTARALIAYYGRLANEYANRLLPVPQPPGREPGPDLRHTRAYLRDESRAWFQHEHQLLRHLVVHADLLPRVGARRPRRGARPIQRRLWRIGVALCVWYDLEGRAEHMDHWVELCEALLRTGLAQRSTAVRLWGTTAHGVGLRRRGDLIPAWEAADTAVGLASRRRRRGLAQAHTNLGLVCLDLNQVGQALRHLDAGWGRRTGRDRRGQAITALALGAAHLRAARRDETGSAAAHLQLSHSYLTRAADLFDSLGDERGVAAALNNLAIVAGEQDSQWDGLAGWERVLARSAELVDPAVRATVLLNMAAVTLVTRPDRVGQVRAQLEESLNLRERLPVSRGTGLTHLYLGDALAAGGEVDRAREHWERAWEMLRGLGHREEAIEAEKRLRQSTDTLTGSG